MKYPILNIVRPFFFLALSLLLFSCGDFLSVDPDSAYEVKIDSEEKIAEMLASAYPTASYSAFLETRTDNVAERLKGKHTRLNEAMYFWEDYDQEDLDTPLNYWLSCYAGIAQANKALELLADYPKTPRVKALYGEAFLLRAYLHFMLVNIWSEPYGTQKSMKALGIPYVTKPEKHAIVTYDRGTVKEVYEKIEKDLKRGITLVDDSYYQLPKYHFNKKAAYAFASRFYLMKGEWELVEKYSDYVLGHNPGRVLRNWQRLEGVRGKLYQQYSSPEQPCNLLLTTTESRYARYLPFLKYGSNINQVISIYDKKGIDGCSAAKHLNMRASFPFITAENGPQNSFYLAKFDEMARQITSGSNPRGLFVTNILFTTDEVMLNRMEALTMQRKYEAAIEQLLLYLQAKFGVELPCPHTAYTWTSTDNYKIYTPFYGMTIKQLALVKTITDFRQKEFFEEGLRWFDIRRFYLPVKRTTTYKNYRALEKEDLRKILQIPAEAINRGLVPNPRVNDSISNVVDPGLPQYPIMK